MENAIAKTPKPSATELLNLAARLETLANTFKKYESTYNYLNGAAMNVRSAVGHAMLEIRDEEIEISVNFKSSEIEE